MDTDLFLTIGVFLAILSVPSLLAAWVEGRVPRMGAIMLIASVVLLVFAATQKPGGYRFDEIPTVMLGVVARFIN